MTPARATAPMLLALLTLLTLVQGCENAPTAPPTLGPAGELQVRPAISWVIEGNSATLGLAAFTASGNPAGLPPVTWSSLDPGVVSVDAEGRVQTLQAGWGRVSATSEAGTHVDTAFIGIRLRMSSVRTGYGWPPWACGLDEGGRAYCWESIEGYQEWARARLGRLGDAPEMQPTRVAGDLVFHQIELGERFACGISQRTGYCWGQGIETWLGMGDQRDCSDYEPYLADCYVPVPIEFDQPIDDIEISHPHSCVSGPAGTFCWGDYRRRVPTLVDAELTGDVAMGAAHRCALTADGWPYCWGDNSNGQLGRTTDGPVDVPMLVSWAKPLTALAAGESFTCGLDSEGHAHCWGQYSHYGGAEAPGPELTAVADMLSFESIHAQRGSVCALTPDGAAYCWGHIGYDTFSAVPQPVAPSHRFRHLGGDWAVLAAGAVVGFGPEIGRLLDPPGPVPVLPRGASADLLLPWPGS